MLNPHSLEVFYYVTRFGGISQSIEHFPYGIGPSAISRQLTQLETEVGVALAERRPFRLTKEGEYLYAHVAPFFEQLAEIERVLRGRSSDRIQLAAPPIVFQDFLGPVLVDLRRTNPRLKFALKEGLHSQIMNWFKYGLVDVAVTTLEGERQPDYPFDVLMKLPLMLVVREDSPYETADDALVHGNRRDTLVCPRLEDAITHQFQRGLKIRSVKWEIGVEVNSIALLESYVLKGLGVGVSVRVPGYGVSPGLRMLPLEDFERISVALIWRRDPGQIVLVLIARMREQARNWALAA